MENYVKLLRTELKSLPPGRLQWGVTPLQAGMPGPWHVVVCTLVGAISRRHHAENLRAVLTAWPTPADLAGADPADVCLALRHGRRAMHTARNLVRFSREWLRDDWSDLRDCRVTVDVCDWVAMVCFRCTDEPISVDTGIRKYFSELLLSVA